MDQRQEHIATLCAASTVAIAATGLALGAEQDNALQYTPGKRKWPGASSSVKSPDSLQTPFDPRRAVSQPTTTTTTHHARSQSSLPSSLFRRKTVQEVRPNTSGQSDTTGSRASSTNRSGFLRPRTADTRSTSEKRDPSVGSAWLKRLSGVSSSHDSSPAPSITHSDGLLPSLLRVRPSTSGPDIPVMPNKLVKRSTSQRALSQDQAKGTFLRRPATSHQRSNALKHWEDQARSVTLPVSSTTPILMTETIDEVNTSPIWRPYFESGYPRKRHTSRSPQTSPDLRLVSGLFDRQPTLISGSRVERRNLFEEEDQDVSAPQPPPVPTSPLVRSSSAVVLSGRQKLRRSLSSMHRVSRRRNVTDSVVQVSHETANGTISPMVTRSPISPDMSTSGFDMSPPHDLPMFNSSPPIIPMKHRFSFQKPQSTAPSDPTTISSDNDTRVFTDDDSMDFHSDTAYDSLATRATTSSQSASHIPKLESMFQPNTHQLGSASAALEKLMQRATLNDTIEHQDHDFDEATPSVGMGISGIGEEDAEFDFVTERSATLTPHKSSSKSSDEFADTPVTVRRRFRTHQPSSPPLPPSLDRLSDSHRNVSENHIMDIEEEDEIDWSPKSDLGEKETHSPLQPNVFGEYFDIGSSPASQPHVAGSNITIGDHRLSIFDWSENQKVNADAADGISFRPKTVHGKQINDPRSRSSGRKAPTQLHLRSQSVPNNRDAHVEQAPLAASKFGTWGLGHKPVSEEWSDDFEFDDFEDEPSPPVPVAIPTRNSLRGVKVPQAIIDRQASVHIQFGQVQEFMMLVEELKRLRAMGLALDLLESHSKQLWEDADSIINLATINNEEDDFLRPPSPTISDIFGEDASPASRTAKESFDEQKRNAITHRSVSTPTAAPSSRPRGESLAQAKNFLQTIHHSRNGIESSPINSDDQPHKKLPFDTQDLKDLVIRSGVITRALKEIVRRAEGVSVSPGKQSPMRTPPPPRDPPFSQIFNSPERSPCPPFRKPGLPKSRSANSYLDSTCEPHGDRMTSFPLTATPV